MKAEAGDELVVAGPDSARQVRIGTIVAVRGRDGSPPYLVHWLTGYESQISPGYGEHVQVRHRPPGDSAETGPVRSCPGR